MPFAAPRPRGGWPAAAILPLAALACTPPHNAECARTPAAGTRAASGTSPRPDHDITGTWLWSCCDGREAWVGELVLVREGTKLRGVCLSDGNSHGSYVDGEIDGGRAWFARRWYEPDGTLAEQFFNLVYDPRTDELQGSFTAPAHSGRIRRLHFARGSTNVPRRGGPDGAPAKPNAIPRRPFLRRVP